MWRSVSQIIQPSNYPSIHGMKLHTLGSSLPREYIQSAVWFVIYWPLKIHYQSTSMTKTIYLMFNFISLMDLTKDHLVIA